MAPTPLLTMCPACNRHVHAPRDATDTECPFCAAPVPFVSPPTGSRRGASLRNLGRAALFAGAGCVMAVSCGGAEDSESSAVEDEPVAVPPEEAVVPTAVPAPPADPTLAQPTVPSVEPVPVGEEAEPETTAQTEGQGDPEPEEEEVQARRETSVDRTLRNRTRLLREEARVRRELERRGIDVPVPLYGGPGLE